MRYQILTILLSLLSVINYSNCDILERHKRLILNSLEMDDRPPQQSNIPYNPYSTSYYSDSLDGAIDKQVLKPKDDSICITPANVVDNCFTFDLKTINSKEIVNAYLIIKTNQLSYQSNISIIVYEIDEIFGESHYLDRFDISRMDNETMTIHFDMKMEVRNWMRKNSDIKMIKIEMISDDYQVIPFHESINSYPYFELEVYQQRSIDNLSCSGCCLIPFYVNFTEIGWDDWILSPRGFNANFCFGGCDNPIDDIHKMLRSVMDSHLIPAPSCVPDYYGHVDFIIAVGPRDIRKKRIHGMRALSCSCM